MIFSKLHQKKPFAGPLVDTKQPNAVTKIIDLFLSAGHSGDIFLRCPTPKKVLRSLQKRVTTIEAAGGLVKNAHKQNLLIFRQGFWDLPKGKAEKGERHTTTARREVMEETGVQNPKIQHFITKTYHIYELRDTQVLKITRWYLMKVRGCPRLTPQTQEEIEIARWVDTPQLPLFLNKTQGKIHGNIVDVLMRVYRKQLKHNNIVSI